MCNLCLQGLATESSSAFTVFSRKLFLGSAGYFVIRTSQLPGKVSVLMLDDSKGIWNKIVLSQVGWGLVELEIGEI